jgi:DivIVA domain-containing protein
MPLTPEDVQNKRFSTVRFKEGYDEEEVDAFLDEVEAELRRLLSEHSEMRTAPGSVAGPPQPAAAVAAPPAPAPPAEEPNEAALRTLLLAQRTADEAIAQAKAEAEQLVAAAKVRASSIESDAQAQHAQSMAELQRQRSTLEAQIEELRAFEREYRTRLKAYLEGQLRDLDAKSTTAPSRPATASGPLGSPTPPAPTPPASTPPMPTPPAPPAAPPPAPSAGVPGLAPPSGRPAATSPFSSSPPLVEDIDAGSDAPAGPPREPEGDSDDTPTAGGAPA